MGLIVNGIDHYKFMAKVEFAFLPLTPLIGFNIPLAGVSLGVVLALCLFRQKTFSDSECAEYASDSDKPTGDPSSYLAPLYVPVGVLYVVWWAAFLYLIPEGLLPIALFLAWFIPVTFVVFFVFTWIVASVIMAQEPDSGDGAGK